MKTSNDVRRKWYFAFCSYDIAECYLCKYTRDNSVFTQYFRAILKRELNPATEKELASLQEFTEKHYIDCFNLFKLLKMKMIQSM